MKHNLLIAILAAGLVSACGGGGSNAGAAATQSSAASTANGSTAGGGASGTSNGASAPPTVITSVNAPAEGSQLAGTTVLSISGQNIANAELLPSAGFSPRLGSFSVAPDGTSATLSFDTTTVPNGPLTLRIAAYNQPSGSAGASETTAMAGRTWQFSNSPPPAGNDAGRTARCQQMGYPATPSDPNDPVVCVVYTRTSTPIDQCQRFGTGYGSPEELLEVLRNGTRISKLYCQPGANNGVLNEGCSCLS